MLDANIQPPGTLAASAINQQSRIYWGVGYQLRMAEVPTTVKSTDVKRLSSVHITKISDSLEKYDRFVSGPGVSAATGSNVAYPGCRIVRVYLPAN